jgi:hypothetical protein
MTLENKYEKEMFMNFLKVKDFTKINDNKFVRVGGSGTLTVLFSKTKMHFKSGSAKITYDLTVEGTKKAHALIDKAFYF